MISGVASREDDVNKLPTYAAISLRSQFYLSFLSCPLMCGGDCHIKLIGRYPLLAQGLSRWFGEFVAPPPSMLLRMNISRTDLHFVNDPLRYAKNAGQIERLWQP